MWHVVRWHLGNLRSQAQRLTLEVRTQMPTGPEQIRGTKQGTDGMESKGPWDEAEAAVWDAGTSLHLSSSQEMPTDHPNC